MVWVHAMKDSTASPVFHPGAGDIIAPAEENASLGVRDGGDVLVATIAHLKGEARSSEAVPFPSAAQAGGCPGPWAPR